MTPIALVVAYCRGGRGQTAAVIGCPLRSFGIRAAQAIDHLDSLHRAIGKDGWPESEWQGDVVRGYLAAA